MVVAPGGGFDPPASRHVRAGSLFGFGRDQKPTLMYPADKLIGREGEDGPVVFHDALGLFFGQSLACFGKCVLFHIFVFLGG